MTARALNRLSARKVQTLSVPGRHADGGGLYLVVDPGGARRWVMLYRFRGRRREMGLGSTLAVPLVRARELAGEARASIAAGVDPLDARRLPIAGRVKFSDVATTFMADREQVWRSEKHLAQWRQTLEVQAAAIWTRPVADVTTEDVLTILRPIWHEKAETARRLRGRIERILDAARAGGRRTGENPARWKGHLDALLPRTRKLTRGHHPSMPYADLPIFFAELTDCLAESAEALQVIILTAARSGEVRGMLKPELDLKGALWTVPAERMKNKREHRVPLAPEAVAILAQAVERSSSDFVFPAENPAKPMSNMVYEKLMQRMGRGHFTPHGFRSSFREWVDAETDFNPDLAEAALSHRRGQDETERAYLRGDALNKRRHLMVAWAGFVTSSSTRTISS